MNWSVVVPGDLLFTKNGTAPTLIVSRVMDDGKEKFGLLIDGRLKFVRPLIDFQVGAEFVKWTSMK